MSIAPDTGHIKSLSDGSGYLACFASLVPPYITLFPVLRWAHVLQNGEHKLVGYIADDTAEAIRVTEPLSDGSIFVSYFCSTNNEAVDNPRLSQIIQRCQSLGKQLALTVPEGGFDGQTES